jgi:hypothetical protein
VRPPRARIEDLELQGFDPRTLEGPVSDPSDAPPGIPPELWSSQVPAQDYVTPSTLLPYPGADLLSLLLPLRYQRPWRLVLAPVLDRDSGRDSLLDWTTSATVPSGGYYMDRPPIVAPPPATGPTVARCGARLVLDLGTDRPVVIDYPARGGVYTIAANRIVVRLFEDPNEGAQAGRPCRYRAELQPGLVSDRWNLPTRTITFGNLNAGEYLNIAVPQRAVAVIVSGANVVSPLNLEVSWYDVTGAVVGSYTSQDPLYTTGPYVPWRVPTDAAYLSVRCPAGLLDARTTWLIAL